VFKWETTAPTTTPSIFTEMGPYTKGLSLVYTVIVPDGPLISSVPPEQLPNIATIKRANNLAIKFGFEFNLAFLVIVWQIMQFFY
jgi:hypothetical protein